MNPELSRRVAIVLPIIGEALKPEVLQSFVARVAVAENFESLDQQDQDVITEAEQEATT